MTAIRRCAVFGARVIACWLLALAIGGCVTTSTGSLGQKGSTKERLDAQLDLARGYLDEGNTSRARVPLNRALDLDNRSVEAHALMGVLSEMEGEPDRAERHFKSALRLNPDDPQTLNNFGRFLHRQGRSEEALAPLRKAVDDPRYERRSQAYENLGLVELRVGSKERAELAFQRALRLNARQPRASLELANLYFDSGDLPAAQQYYNGFMGQARQTARSLWLGIRIARAHGNDDQVASYALALKNLFAGSREYKRYEESLK